MKKMAKKSLFKVFLFLLFILGSFYIFLLWLEQPGLVYQHYEKSKSAVVASVLGEVISSPSPTVIPTPINTDFSLLIPKIELNAPVIANVDGGNPREYLWRVTQGIAHFKPRRFANVEVDGALPGETGNIFLFGHSQIPGGDTSNFKGVFNNLIKLIPGDKVYIFYQGQKLSYEVTEAKVVPKTALEYLEPTSEETLTLMTCWPLGLDIKRYIVRARRVS